VRTRAERQSRSEHDGVEQVAFETQKIGHCAVVEGTGQGRHEIDVPGRSALQEAAARHLDHDLELGRIELECFMVGISQQDGLALHPVAAQRFRPVHRFVGAGERTDDGLAGLVLRNADRDGQRADRG